MNGLKTIYLSLLLILAMSIQGIQSIKAENYPYRSDYLWLATSRKEERAAILTSTNTTRFCRTRIVSIPWLTMMS